MPQEYTPLSDQRLSALVRDGDPQAFVGLSARYIGLIRNKAALFCGPAVPEPEDLLQEGFLGLYAAALGYRDSGGSFGTYAGACIYNQMVSAVRRNATAGNRTLTEAMPLAEAGDPPEWAMGPQDLVEMHEQFDSMWQRLELTPLERRVLDLYFSGSARRRVKRHDGRGKDITLPGVRPGLPVYPRGAGFLHKARLRQSPPVQGLPPGRPPEKGRPGVFRRLCRLREGGQGLLPPCP